MSNHPTAQIDPGARIGTGVTIGPFAVVDRDVELGDGCVLGPHVTILRHTRLGPGCRVHAGAVLGDVPQDLAFRDVPSFVEIGGGSTIREGVTIHRGTKEGTVTRTGENCFLMANSHLAHNVQLGNRVTLANGVLLAGYVEVGDDVFMGGNAAVHQFCRVGRLAMVGGLSAVSKDVPPFCMVATGGYNRVVGLNAVGLRRAGVSSDNRLAARRAFRRIFLEGAHLREAAQAVCREIPGGPAQELAEFILSSKRGVCAHRSRDGHEDDADGQSG